MIIVFLLLAAAVGTGVYLLVMYSSIPGAVDERLGTLEPLPENLGQWVVDPSADAEPASGEHLQREVRWLHDPGRLFHKETLIRQVRYRDLASGEITRVDPEERLPRKRRKEA